MGLIDKLKTAGEQATASARDTVHEAQLKRELADAFGDLGRSTFELLEEGVVNDARLTPAAERVRQLQAELSTSRPGAA